MGLLRNAWLGIALSAAVGSAMASSLDYQTSGVGPDNLPVMAPQLKARLNFSMAWSPQVKDLVPWRTAVVAKLWELALQASDHTLFDAQVIEEVDRGTYVVRKVAFNLTADSRVLGLLLPKGRGPFPAAVLYHDHGARFDIGKEKMIAPWGDPALSDAITATVAVNWMAATPAVSMLNALPPAATCPESPQTVYKHPL